MIPLPMILSSAPGRPHPLPAPDLCPPLNRRRMFLRWFRSLVVKVVVLVAVVVACPARAQVADPLRTFTDRAGRRLEAKVRSYDGRQVTIERADGAVFTVPASTFSDADQAFLEEWKKREAVARPPLGADASPGESANAGVAWDALNRALGQPLWQGPGSLWDEEVAAVADRLKWPKESRTSRQASFRLYPGSEYRLAGARPFSAALYAEGGRPTSVSLVFANRGDFFGAKGSGEEHFERDQALPDDALVRLNAAIKEDAEAIATTLSGVLGEPEKQNYGEGESRRRVRRWDWVGHAFLLSEEEDQYVGLAVVPSALADLRGRTARVSDASVRERLRASLDRRDHGDVVIKDLPMVDQGPKGYCVPATCERAMRHVGMTADMYLLAVAGGSGLGGGASVQRTLETIGRDLKRKGRSFERLEGPLSLKKISPYLEKGLPVLWMLDSTPAFNELANRRTAARRAVTDWAAWKAQLDADEAAATLTRDPRHGHCAMIIGFNKDTGEIALSDSWGERYAERWVCLKAAQAVSMGEFYVIGL